MGASQEYIKFIQELLAPLGTLTEGKFFGGFAFKYGSKQFAMIMENTLYFCVDDQTRPRYENINMKPFYYTTKKGLVYVKKYFTVPESLFEEPDKLIAWAKEAIKAAHRYK